MTASQTLVNFLRSNIESFDSGIDAYVNGKDTTVVFKPYTDKSKGFVISLDNYDGSSNLVDVVKNMPTLNPTAHASVVSDMFIGSILREMDESSKDTKKELGQRIMHSLRLSERKEMSIKDSIIAITKYLSDLNKVYTRAYNVSFPHGTHDDEKLPEGVNVIYLQRMPMITYNAVLNGYIKGNITDDAALLEIARSEYLKQANLSAIDALQLRHPDIIPSVINPPKRTTRSGRETSDAKWMTGLKRVKSINAKGVVMYYDETMTHDDVKNIQDLTRELILAKGLIKQLQSTIVSRALEYEEQTYMNANGKAVTKKINKRSVDVDADLGKSLVEFNQRIGAISAFQTKWLQDVSSQCAEIARNRASYRLLAKDDEDPELVAKNEERRLLTIVFMEYLIHAADVVKTYLSTHDGMNPFKVILDTAGVSLPRKILTQLTKIDNPGEIDSDKIHELVAQLYEEWNPSRVPSTCIPSSIDSYDRIASSLGYDLPKSYRVAIGAGVVNYILSETRLIMGLSANRMECKIFIK